MFSMPLSVVSFLYPPLWHRISYPNYTQSHTSGKQTVHNPAFQTLTYGTSSLAAFFIKGRSFSAVLFMPLSYIALRHEIWAGENLIFFFLGSFLTGSTSEPNEVERVASAHIYSTREKGAGSFPNAHAQEEIRTL